MYLPSTVCHGTTYMWVAVWPFALHTMCLIMACSSTYTHKHVCVLFRAASARVTVRLAHQGPALDPIAIRLAEKVSQSVSHPSICHSTLVAEQARSCRFTPSAFTYTSGGLDHTGLP